MLTLFLAVAASAATWDVTLCARVNLDYIDIDNGEDRWTDVDTAAKPARGFWARVYDNDTSTYIWPDATNWGVLEAGSTNTGCTPEIPLDSTHDYDLRVRTVATVGGHEIWGYDDETTQATLSTEAITAFAPTQDDTVVGYLEGSTEARWNHLALMTFALAMHDGLGASETIELYEDSNGCGNATNSGEIHLGNGNDCSKRKFVVAHELGHVVSFWSDPGHTASPTLSDHDDCNGGAGGYLRKNYAKAAFLEGVADLYSALTWNTLTSGSCMWARGSGDFNLDGIEDYTDYDPQFSLWPPCVGDPLDYETPDPDDRDWLEDLVNGDDDDVDGKQCDDELPNRLTDYDFLRYAWEMLTEEGMEVADFWQVWDDADVRSSDGDDNDSGSNGSISTADDTFVLWEAACDANGFGNAHDDSKSHGLDH
jgi:hypothetical protein